MAAIRKKRDPVTLFTLDLFVNKIAFQLLFSTFFIEDKKVAFLPRPNLGTMFYFIIIKPFRILIFRNFTCPIRIPS